jgi:hypothetical protein
MKFIPKPDLIINTTVLVMKVATEILIRPFCQSKNGFEQTIFSSPSIDFEFLFQKDKYDITELI